MISNTGDNIKGGLTATGRIEFAPTPMEYDREIDSLRTAIKMALTALGTDPQAELRIYKARTILATALKQ